MGQKNARRQICPIGAKTDQSERDMTIRQLTGATLAGLALWAVIIAGVLALTGCAAPTPGIEYTGRPDSYRTFGPSMTAAPAGWAQLSADITRPMHSAHPWRADLEALRGQPLEAQVRGVAELMETIKCVECGRSIRTRQLGNDRVIVESGDRWQSPDDTIQKGGDCEDHALVVMHALHHLGVESRLLVGATPIGDHAVLEVGPWIIDNGGTVLPDIGEFRIIYALSAEGKTTYLAGM